MYEVTVKKTELLQTLRENRAGHRDVFLKAQEGYKKQLIEYLDQMIEAARAGKKVKHRIDLAEPQDRTKDYDRIIKMVEMNVEEHIKLDSVSFDRYVMDNWEWKDAVTTTNTAYAALAENGNN